MSEPVERVARQVDRLCWTGILLGLAFTMTNVQQFAAAGAATWSLVWCAAWLLDPMVSLVLLAILRAEQVTAQRGVRMGGWVRTAKWFTLGATYVMNTWSAFTAGSAASVVLHSVPPLVVFVAAEAVTELRGKLGAVVVAAVPSGSLPVAKPPARPVRRTSFSEYLAVAEAARTPDVVVTPAWVRQVTGCSRGLSSRLAAVLNQGGGRS
ncbi:hypothetical protein [Actinosynnema pretiosum]|uniref:DUF2637 domain-containing protein n=1 Tax=Actinosynnema pretiosum TaxID=42197 RepID=A0A290Z9S4_9PSEU|nr:hypothetical protein [Actinosynnema pretiosum]ATE55732.1 hypothetical protein CNX65_22605 [Actinosynnema pretiosum]